MNNLSSLIEVNELLTEYQKYRHRQTPFTFVVDLHSTIKVNAPLLNELVMRLDESSLGFHIRNVLVPFTTLDLCIAIGLLVKGLVVTLEDSRDCLGKQIMEGHKLREFHQDKKEVNTSDIRERMKHFQEEDDVDNFCRLYILLAFFVFYFPRTKYKSLRNLALPLLDNMDDLHKFNWGGAVYCDLVEIPNKVSTKYRSGKNSREITIVGCTLVLQVLFYLF